MIFSSESQPCHSPEPMSSGEGTGSSVKLFRPNPPLFPGSSTMGPMGTPCWGGQPCLLLELPKQATEAQGWPQTRPALGTPPGVETAPFFSQGSGGGLPISGLGQARGRVGGECGEEGVAELRHEHVRVQQRVLSMGTGVFQPSGACASKACPSSYHQRGKEKPSRHR